MFIEPRAIQTDCSHGCPAKCITLVLSNASKHTEYTLLLTCERVPVSYLMDLYCLYHETNAPTMGRCFVKTVTTLEVDGPTTTSPENWLTCIKWSRYQRRGSDASLEWFIARPKRSAFYYSVGETGTLLVSRDDPSNTLKINKETVDVLTGYGCCCSRPMVYRVDWNLEREVLLHEEADDV